MTDFRYIFIGLSIINYSFQAPKRRKPDLTHHQISVKPNTGGKYTESANFIGQPEPSVMAPANTIQVHK